MARYAKLDIPSTGPVASCSKSTRPMDATCGLSSLVSFNRPIWSSWQIQKDDVGGLKVSSELVANLAFSSCTDRFPHEVAPALFRGLPGSRKQQSFRSKTPPRTGLLELGNKAKFHVGQQKERHNACDAQQTKRPEIRNASGAQPGA